MRTEQTILPGLMSARAVFQNFTDEFLYMKKHSDWGVLTYTFHPHVIGRGQRMLALEQFIETLSEEGARFVTMETAVAAYRDRHPSGVSLRG
jgi:peptidoglycan-N-acetylglucosamine deacetylase